MKSSNALKALTAASSSASISVKAVVFPDVGDGVGTGAMGLTGEVTTGNGVGTGAVGLTGEVTTGDVVGTGAVGPTGKEDAGGNENAKGLGFVAAVGLVIATGCWVAVTGTEVMATGDGVDTTGAEVGGGLATGTGAGVVSQPPNKHPRSMGACPGAAVIVITVP